MFRDSDTDHKNLSLSHTGQCFLSDESAVLLNSRVFWVGALICFALRGLAVL